MTNGFQLSYTTTFDSKGEKQLESAFQRLTKEAAKFETTISGIKNTSVVANKTQEKLAKSFDDGKKTITTYTAQLDKLTNSYKVYESVTKKQIKANGDLVQHTSKQEIIDKEHIKRLADSGRFTDKATEALKKQDSAGISFNQTLLAMNNRLANLRWAMVNIAFVAGAFVAAFAPFVLITKWGMDLELMFKKISIVTGESTEVIKRQIIELRRGTQFSMKEMGEAFFEFTKQGFSAQDAFIAMPHIVALSVAGFVDLKKAVEIVGQVMFSFNLEAKDAERITTLLAAAANKSRADVETFGTALSYVSPIAAQAGISVEELNAALAILSNR